MEHRGEIVRAQLLDYVNDTFYKFMARIESGHEAGREGYVAYRGDHSSIGGNILVMLQDPSKRSNLEFDGSVATSNFVTSSIPFDFDFSSSEDTILYGIWEERMRGGYDVPGIGSVSNFFDIGMMPKILHYHSRGGPIMPYDAVSRLKPEVMSKGRGRIRNLGSALRHYLRNHLVNSPIVVTVDEEIDLERMILSEFQKIIESPQFSITRYIQMEPQQ